MVPWWHLTDLSSPSVDGVSAPDAPLVCTRPGWSGLYLAGNITLTSVRLSETPSSETARRGEISGGPDTTLPTRDQTRLLTYNW